VNLLLTMVLGGIWHGAGWTFLIWGAYHGALLTINHLWRGWNRSMPVWMGRVSTFVAVMIGWAIFRAKDWAEARAIIQRMFDLGSFRLAKLASGLQLEMIVFLAALVAFVNLAPTTKQWVESRPLRPVHAAAIAVLFCVGLFFVRNVDLKFSRSEFIYFQF
jgi:D-alanyl-lipoteichoic acid acyltransferase DltB (MBOAT superfamily)